MPETIGAISHQIATAGELHQVVRTMKALAAANIGQYERAVRSLAGYYHTVQLGLAACMNLLEGGLPDTSATDKDKTPTGVILFGSDQGLVGQFNAALLAFAEGRMRTINPVAATIPAWILGDRLKAEAADCGFSLRHLYELPLSVETITPTVNELLITIGSARDKGQLGAVYIFHNKPVGKAGYEPVMQRLLPLEDGLKEELAGVHWPGRQRPDIIGGVGQAATTLVREYLFVSLYKACAESLASENASRLAAMEHAEKNIGELSDELMHAYHRLRQDSIDEELFDVIFGAEAVGRD